MTRKAKHSRTTQPSTSRPHAITVGAILASAAFTTLHASNAAARDRFDPRLAVIDRALASRAPLLHIVTRQSVSPQPARPATQTFALDIPAAPIRQVAAALERATGVRVTLANEFIGNITSPGCTGTFTFQQALQLLLDGTNATFRMGGGAAILDIPGLSESVSVSGDITRTVASPKYHAPLRDIPQTIEIIPRAAMDAQGVTTLSEALRNVPGITMQAGEGGGASSTAGDMFNMRGFNASNSLFVDNVRDDGLVSRDVFNIQQVEVFMGPTGSDVGRGTAAGYVNMQTKMPQVPNAASANLTYGAANQRRATADVNRAFNFGRRDGWLSKSAVRLNVLWQDSGVPGRDEVENASRAVAPSIGLGIGTRTRVLASAQILRQDNIPDYGIPGAAWHETVLAPTTVHSARAVERSNYYGSPAYDSDKAKQNTATVRIAHDMRSRWMLTNQTRYNRTEREAIISTIQNVAAYAQATDLVTIARQGNIRENQITSNQTSLTGRAMTGRIEHNLSSGIEVSRESQFAPALAGLGTRAPVNIYNPNPDDPVAGFAPARTGTYTRGRTDTFALYGFDSASLGTRVQVNAGLRLERYDTEFYSFTAPATVAQDLDVSDTLLSGKAGVVFRLRPTANLYASYGTTVTPPGTANFNFSATANNQNNPNVDPQRSSNVEAGVKWDAASGRLSLNASVFHTINRNVLFTVDAAAIPPIFNQDDKQRVDGVTLGATGEITPRWHVLASLGYLDTESLSQNRANDGRRLTLSPKYAGSAWTTYRLPRNVTVGGGVRATGKVFVNAANTIAAPGYYVADALVEYAVNQHLSLRLNIYNITDTRYIRNVNNNGGRYNPGYPRTAQLTSAISF